ncbi:hypothetical protein M569_05438 [Genlisea aurea]|uniref:Uncharacterized protein n=1 Tax=Genlisea aurea TaxID=192259 RepID=S8EA56_9LAMI|nr:hypothetical protein M569_05438 [Genlisea aurea]
MNSRNIAKKRKNLVKKRKYDTTEAAALTEIPMRRPMFEFGDDNRSGNWPRNAEAKENEEWVKNAEADG